MPFLTHALVFFATYLLGTLSWSYLAVRALKGEDLRDHGSGNLGATNAGRVLGKKWAVIIYFADMIKGFGPTFLAMRWDDPTIMPPFGVMAGFGVILGHLFPFWLSFRGGKGVATGSGVVLALSPLTALVSIAVWFLVLKASRYVSLASVLATASLPVIYVLLAPTTTTRWWYTGFLAVVAGIVVVAHRTNIQRILQGTEKKVGTRA